MLIVLDGWGHGEESAYNAINVAKKPNWDRLMREYPHELIRCSGTDVGLPDGQMGNSEVGHMHLGAGRTINQDFTRISLAIENGEFADNAAWQPAMQRAAADDKAVHILGLLSPGGVHSHEDHILALVDAAAHQGVRQIYIHAFLDGRDTPPRSAANSIRHVEDHCGKLGAGRIATLVGRYLAMDRNTNWERTRDAYELIVDGKAEHSATTPLTALDAAYTRDESDEFVKTTTIVPAGKTAVRINDGDVVIFANFRADRARQLTAAFTEPDFSEFDRTRIPALAAFVTMTSYSAKFRVPTAFPPTEMKNTFGEWVAAHGLKQLRIAETEKYAHVTFFFDGGIEQAAAGEDRILIDSPDVATYDLQPEMSAVEVTDALVAAIGRQHYDTIVCNYANADMVGHTGDFDATVRCIQTLDACLGRVVDSAVANGMEILITADHGNAEKMRASANSKQAHTAHTSNLVPLIYVGRPGKIAADGCLSDIAPTMLTLMGLERPAEMTGRPLVALNDAEQAAA
jgi:2,3-bisphosphoglycerate-independent phosphoglycerate mutase